MGIPKPYIFMSLTAIAVGVFVGVAVGAGVDVAVETMVAVGGGVAVKPVDGAGFIRDQLAHDYRLGFEGSRADHASGPSPCSLSPPFRGRRYSPERRFAVCASKYPRAA